MPVKIFFCYAHEDEQLLNKLKNHLFPLERAGLIDVWHDRDISAGTDWEQQIKSHLNEAQIILLLVSPDFMVSDYCYGIEMQRALERHELGEARVIPIILRHVYWQGVLGKLQALPTDARPIKSWPDLDEALYNVTEGIRIVIQEITPKSSPPPPILSTQPVSQTPLPTNLPDKSQKTKEQWLEEGNWFHVLGLYQKAVDSYTEAIKIDENLANAWSGKGEALRGVKKFEEALAAFERAIQLDSENASFYVRKGDALNDQKKYTDALAAYEKAIELDPNYMWAWQNKALVLERLAKEAPEKAEQFNHLAQQAYRRARQLGYNG